VAAALVVSANHLIQAGRAGPVISRTIAGRKVLIDPGHGGIDPGVVSGDLQEKDFTLAISLQLKKLFMEAGVPVLLTRETDTDLCYSQEAAEAGRRKKLDLRTRVSVTESSGADVYLGIHVNGSNSSQWNGPQTFYCSQANALSGRLAVLIQEEMARLSPTQRQAIDTTGQYMLKTLKVPAVTVEVGFLSNAKDTAQLVQPEHQRKLAWAIFTGTVRFFAEEPKAPGAGPPDP
jgi:N-acetylmuramoyl-L-alanine amidase